MAPYAIRIDFRQNRLEVAGFLAGLPIYVGADFIDEGPRIGGRAHQSESRPQKVTNLH